MLNFPSGPSTSTVAFGSVLLALLPVFGDGVGKKRKVTSGGRARGAAPILDGRGVVVENRAADNLLDVIDGTRKVGRVKSLLLGVWNIVRSTLDVRTHSWAIFIFLSVVDQRKDNLSGVPA